MFSPARCSRSQAPWPPMPTPAMFSLLLGEAPPRPRTRAGRNVNVAIAVALPRKARREMPADLSLLDARETVHREAACLLNEPVVISRFVCRFWVLIMMII